MKYLTREINLYPPTRRRVLGSDWPTDCDCLTPIYPTLLTLTGFLSHFFLSLKVIKWSFDNDRVIWFNWSAHFTHYERLLQRPICDTIATQLVDLWLMWQLPFFNLFAKLIFYANWQRYANPCKASSSGNQGLKFEVRSETKILAFGFIPKEMRNKSRNKMSSMIGTWTFSWPCGNIYLHWLQEQATDFVEFNVYISPFKILMTCIVYCTVL